MGRRAKPAKNVKARAKRPVARKAPKKAAAAVGELKQRLAEGLEREKATGEILRVIGESPSDIRPVLDTLVERALRLCRATLSAVFGFDGRMISVLATNRISPEEQAIADRMFPAPVSRKAPGLPRVIVERKVVHVSDIRSDPEWQAHASTRALVDAGGYRTFLGVPMMREGTCVGIIACARREVRPFTATQIALLQTFAGQAVIAIENVRLFTELQQKNGELTQAHAQVTETLEQQTATSEVLRVISSTQTDLEPVFDTIVRNAGRVCDADDCVIALVDGAEAEVAAHWGPIEATLGSRFPLTRGTVLCRAILDVRAVHVDDLPGATDFPQGQDWASRLGYRTTLAVPLLRESRAIGGLLIRRAEVRPFSDKQIAMLQTFADQAVIAIENVRLFTELQATNHELTSALDTQTATSDILRVISRSQTDVQPVFDAILTSAVRLLGAYSGLLTRVAGDQIEIAALTSTDDAGDAAVRARYPQSLQSEGSHAQAIRARAPLNIVDRHTDPRLPEAAHALARIRGNRSQVVVPLLRHDEAIGSIGVSRREPGGFTADEIALLKTFADQAVIAIENARLLSELQERNEALSEALEQQTATSEILKVIASSPTDAQPVFNAIVNSARRLLRAAGAIAFRRIGDEIHLAAHTIRGDVPEEALTSGYPVPFNRMVSDNPLSTRAWVNGEVGNVPDAVSDPRWPERLRRPARALGIHGLLIVPMRRDDLVLGVITVMRREPGLFSDTEIELLKTFADQAVIAVENVRLFTELQASNRELTSALNTQTATSDILRVISRSQTDVQPVFDAIVHSAVHLLGGHSGGLTRIVGDQRELAAFMTTDPAAAAALSTTYPRPMNAAGAHGQAIRDRAPVNIVDMHTDLRVTEAGRTAARLGGYRSVVTVPLLRHDEAIGALGVTRREAGGFSDDEITLLQTFADQAVIAIENARLLTELRARTEDLTRSVGELRALGEIGQAIGSTLDLQTVLATIVARATQLAGADAGVIYEYDEQREVFEPRATERLEDAIVQALVATPIRKAQGVTGRLAEVRAPIQQAEIITLGEQLPVRDALIHAGYRALLAVPLLREDHLIGGLTVFRKTPGEFAVQTVELLQTFATQSALAIQNARLFREIEVKGRELEVASQHKSEFLASMSHELRTPLNAIIGFSDVLLQGMFGETNDKQTEYLRDILSSGQHLLSLINDILDLSKIEAGRMELDLASFDLPTAIDDAMLLMRERAGRRGIALERQVDARVGEIQADQRKVKQVLLNLLSNAVKFTPEDGRIDVRAGLANGTAEISVTDTGIGIAAEDHDAVFEEFRQVGAAEKKAEGTGLGLALCRKFVELHGGRIWVKSQIGAGSTFTFTLPLVPTG